MLHTLPGESKQGYIHQNCIISCPYLAYQYQRHFQFLTLCLHSVWQLNMAFTSEHYFKDYFLSFLFVCFFLLGTNKIFRLLVASSFMFLPFLISCIRVPNILGLCMANILRWCRARCTIKNQKLTKLLFYSMCTNLWHLSRGL